MPSSKPIDSSHATVASTAITSSSCAYSIPSLVRNELACRLLDLLLARQKFFLQRRRIGHRSIERFEDSDRCVEKFKGLFLDDGRDGFTDRTAAGVFVNDHHAAAAACQAQNGFAIERHEAAQIEDRGFDSILGQSLRHAHA